MMRANKVVEGYLILRREHRSGCGRRTDSASGLDDPLGYGLMEIEWPGHRHVRLHIFESCALQRAIRCHVECVRLAKETLESEFTEVDANGIANASRAEPYVPVLRFHHMQMHIGALAKDDAVR